VEEQEMSAGQTRKGAKNDGTTGDKRRGKRFRWLAILLLILAVAFMGGSYITSRYFTLLYVTSNGMENTLQAGDVVGCRNDAPVARGDIVAFERDSALMMKRVIAVAGDEVQITESGKVLVNGTEISEPYLYAAVTDAGDETYPLTVPDGEVFVAGDNRAMSLDSRNKAVGTISLREIIGVAALRIWPVYRIGAL
jgi:signal peptidase I